MSAPLRRKPRYNARAWHRDLGTWFRVELDGQGRVLDSSFLTCAFAGDAERFEPWLRDKANFVVIREDKAA